MIDACIQTDDPSSREAITQTLIIDMVDEDCQTYKASSFDEQVQVNILKVSESAEVGTEPDREVLDAAQKEIEVQI